MRIHIDPDLCEGHNRCALAIGDLVDIDELGFARERGDGVVPDGRGDAARLAARNCPERAISLLDDTPAAPGGAGPSEHQEG